MPQAPSGTENVQGEQSAVDDMADKVVAGFTDFAYRLTPDQLTGAPILAAKRCLLDAVGCAVNAYDFAPVVALRSLARTATSTRPATLFGTTEQTDAGHGRLRQRLDDPVPRLQRRLLRHREHQRARRHRPAPERQHRGVLAAAEMARRDGPDHAPRNRASPTRFVDSWSTRSSSAATAGTTRSSTASRPLPRPLASSGSLPTGSPTPFGSPSSRTSACTRPGSAPSPTGRVWPVRTAAATACSRRCSPRPASPAPTSRSRAPGDS